MSVQPTRSPSGQKREQGKYVPPLSLPSGKQIVHRKLQQASAYISLTSKLSPGHFQCREAEKGRKMLSWPPILCLPQRKTKIFQVTLGTCPLGNQTISALRDLKNKTPMHPFKNTWLIAYFACNTVLARSWEVSGVWWQRKKAGMKREEMSSLINFSSC